MLVVLECNHINKYSNYDTSSSIQAFLGQCEDLVLYDDRVDIQLPNSETS